MPKVSVLMPIHNTQESHLREAIESILAQSYPDFELLILNDSPENTKLDAIVASYSDTRICYTKNEANLGITGSRNKLMSMAQGEYFAIMDHDDISLPERFAKQVAFLDTHEDIGVVGTWYQEIVGGKLRQYPTENNVIESTLLSSYCIHHPTTMIRASIFVKNDLQYEEEFSPSEDYRLWCRLIGKTCFANIAEILFQYRNHTSRTSLLSGKKLRYIGAHIKNDVRATHPLLWQKAKTKVTFMKKIKILGVPFFFIYTKNNLTKCYLWNCIPLYSIITRDKKDL